MRDVAVEDLPASIADVPERMQQIANFMALYPPSRIQLLSQNRVKFGFLGGHAPYSFSPIYDRMQLGHRQPNMMYRLMVKIIGTDVRYIPRSGVNSEPTYAVPPRVVHHLAHNSHTTPSVYRVSQAPDVKRPSWISFPKVQSSLKFTFFDSWRESATQAVEAFRLALESEYPLDPFRARQFSGVPSYAGIGQGFTSGNSVSRSSVSKSEPVGPSLFDVLSNYTAAGAEFIVRSRADMAYVVSGQIVSDLIPREHPSILAHRAADREKRAGAVAEHPVLRYLAAPLEPRLRLLNTPPVETRQTKIRNMVETAAVGIDAARRNADLVQSVSNTDLGSVLVGVPAPVLPLTAEERFRNGRVGYQHGSMN